MHKVYHPYPLKDTITISEEESRHLSKVLRLSIGDQVKVLNGRGDVAVGEIALNHAKKSEIKIVSLSQHKQRSEINLTLAIAPTKNMNRLEWFTEKAMEIGVDRIVPILCTRSERKHLKNERLSKILVSAMKQSGQVFLPQLDELTPLKSFISDNPNGLMAYVDAEADTPQLSKAIENQNNLTILIGPEGDFSPEEVKFAKDTGYTFVKLGPSVLRTETAGVYVCSIVNSK